MALEEENRNRLYMEVDSRAENIGLVRLAVATLAAQASFSVAEIEEMKVAVSEAVSNSILHGYPDRQGIIRVCATLSKQGIGISVRDEGVGMEDVEACRKSGGGGDPERMGLGFMFMQSLMDELEVESAPGEGTTVKMFKRLDTAASSRG
ncbi:MAG: anti-sigma F factor [Ignavibacteriales bacterium]